MSETAKTMEWLGLGGVLEIPDGWCVVRADFDVAEPFINIMCMSGACEEKKLLIPKALAYYLGTHFCGSNVMRDLIREHAQREIQNVIKDALGL